ncbi:MAG: ammonia channel protein [Verrucomicrobia bacterium]|nr:MAG: ammonia channel protein [Verrucomicrobiota bacterium]
MTSSTLRRLITLLIPCLLAASSALAQDATPAVVLDSGDTAWMLTATVLVLFMTLPGLALFYGGLVRAKNLLSVLMQCFAIACLASILWVVGLYSLAFSEGNTWIGDLKHFLLGGIGTDELNGNSFPETVFLMFQMTFAIITPGLIIGSVVERIKFSAVLLFTTLWLILVYVPVAHWVWGGGWMMDRGVIDLAGGIVVHTTAGISALVLAAMLGPRNGFPKRLHPPHSPGLVMIGASMLWVGWFGFNAGSQIAANGSAGMTMLVTHIAAAVASLTWMTVEWLKTGKPGLVGIVTGMVAGLATITPASGNVGPLGAALLGLLAGLVCYIMCGFIKNRLKIDDSLDVFAVHGVGGIVGSVLVAVFGVSAFGGRGVDSMGSQLITQVTGVGATVIWSAGLTAVIVLAVKAITGLRMDPEDEETGLDQASHGESAYNMEN